MKMKMHKCRLCGGYTLQKKCPYCEGDLRVVYPPKYSPNDKYGKYRRLLKKQMLTK